MSPCGRAALLLLLLAPALPADAIEVVAHRGRLAPDQAENSLRQMRATAAAGFAIELDLRQSRDGTLWLLHDPTLERTTTGHGAIAGQRDAALARLALRGAAGESDGEPLPRFQQVARWAGATPGVTLLLDFKDIDPARLRPLLRRHRLLARAILLTFDPDSARRALDHGGGARVSVLVKDEADLDRYRRLAAGRPLALYLPQDAAAALFRAAAASGIPVISDALPLRSGTALDAVAAGEGCAAYARFLAGHPLDWLVSDAPACARAGLAGTGAATPATAAAPAPEPTHP
jgi:glycerophosphoryl diester phosphodiesterase